MPPGPPCVNPGGDSPSTTAHLAKIPLLTRKLRAPPFPLKVGDAVMIELALVVVHDAGTHHERIVELDRLPAPGEQLTLANGELVTVQAVEPDPRHPEHVTLHATID